VSNKRSLTEYWNFCFTDFSKLTYIYVFALVFLTRYFASEMNACKSLGGVILSTWYAVVITCRGRHWSNCQREPAHVAETMKFLAGLETLNCDL